MSKNIISALKYFAVFCIGFLTNFSGFLNNITSIPNSYNDFKKEYLYDSELLSGKWSTNTEYLIDGAELGLGFDQPRITINLDVDEFGKVKGELLSKNICDALPFTWAISLESPEPELSLFLLDRRFYLKQLMGGKMQTVAEFKLANLDNRKPVMILERVDDPQNILPRTIRLAKNLPAYDYDFKELSDYCVESTRRFFKKMAKDSVNE